MKRILLVIVCITTFISIWAYDLPVRPSIEQNRPRTEELLASYTYSLADTLTFELEDKYQAEYTYQANNLELVTVKELFENGWLEIEKYFYEYDENGVTEELYQVYDDGWVNYQVTSYVYNSDGLLSDYQLDYWLDNSWAPYLNINYIYNSQRELINEEWVYYTTREIDSAYNLTYQYDNQGRVIGETWTISTDNINWDNYLKGNYTLDANDSIINEDWQYWYETNWYSYFQYNHTYNSFNKIEYTEGLSLTENQWSYSENYSYTYNDNQNVEQLLAKVWSTDENDWVNSYKYVYIYQALVSNDDNAVLANDFQVSLYPNPFQTEVKYEAKELLNKLSVYNLKGQEVYSTLLNSKKGTLPNLNNYANGIYFFKFEDGKGRVSVSKQIKLK